MELLNNVFRFIEQHSLIEHYTFILIVLSFVCGVVVTIRLGMNKLNEKRQVQMQEWSAFVQRVKLLAEKQKGGK